MDRVDVVAYSSPVVTDWEAAWNRLAEDYNRRADDLEAAWAERAFYRSALADIAEKCGDDSSPEHNAVQIARTALLYGSQARP